MAPDLDAPRHAACPACGAALRPGSPWCTLCYADLRPPEERPAPTPTSAPAHASYGPAAGDPLTQPLLDFIAPAPTSAQPTAPAPLPRGAGWPCLTCGSANPLEATHCTVCGAPFLAAVGQATRRSYVLPVIGDLARLSRTQRVLGALGIAVLIVLPVAVITALLSKPTPAPAPDEQTTPPPLAPIQTFGPTETPTPSPTPTVPGLTPTSTAPYSTPSPTVTVTP